MEKRYHNQQGLTLIETLIAMTLSSIILMIAINQLNLALKSYTTQRNTLKAQRNMQFAMNYIEKRIRELDQNEIIYHGEIQTIEGKDYKQAKAWIDLSGNTRSSLNTLIYFYRDRGELRVNKNRENNVLVEEIKEVTVREITEGALIEILIYGEGIETPIKSTIKLGHSLKGEKL